MERDTVSDDQMFERQPDESEAAWSTRISRETRFQPRPGESQQAWSARVGLMVSRPMLVEVLCGCVPAAARGVAREFLQSAGGDLAIDCMLSNLYDQAGGHAGASAGLRRALHERRVDAMAGLARWVEEKIARTQAIRTETRSAEIAEPDPDGGSAS
jgi:hypothetical protein